MSDFRLKVFSCVAKHLSFTKAAEELLISQPAITKHIKELESIYNVRLFERNGNKIEITNEGKLLYQHSEKIINDYNNLDFEMHLLQNTYKGELHIGASSTIAQYVLPPLLAKYSENFPDIKIDFLSGNSRDIESLLHEHKIDIGLVEGISRDSTLHYEKFLDDELVGVISTKCPFAKDEITIEELISTPLVMREHGSGTLDVIKKELSENNIKLSDLNIVMHMGSTESIKLFLDYSHAMGIVSVRSISKDLITRRFRIIDIDGLEMKRQFMWVERQGQDKGLTEVFKEFVNRNNYML